MQKELVSFAQVIKFS